MPYGVAKGYFGTLTQAALIRYQASVGIYPAYGYFDATTRARVSAEYQSPYPQTNCTTYGTILPCVNPTLPISPISNVTPYLRIVSPNGNETYRSGDTMNIQWESVGLNSRSMELCLVNYRDECYRSLGNVPATVYNSYTNRDSTTRYIDSSIPSGEYKLMLRAYGASNGYFNYGYSEIPVSDQSDGWFRINTGYAGNLVITPSTLPDVFVNNYYNQLLRADNYSSTYYDSYSDPYDVTWRISSGSLPPGLSLDRDYNYNYGYNSGYRAYIRGTAYTTGTYYFTVEISDRYRTTTQSYTVVVRN